MYVGLYCLYMAVPCIVELPGRKTNIISIVYFNRPFTINYDVMGGKGEH